jgi:hypothetical protein
MENDMTNEEKMMYGMSADDIRNEIINSFTTSAVGIEMSVMSILSDAQQVLEWGDKDRARKYMNIAKFILSEMMIHKQKTA